MPDSNVDVEKAESEQHTKEIQDLITLGFPAVCFAGILTLYASQDFDWRVYSALGCFITVIPVSLTAFFLSHPLLDKELNLAGKLATLMGVCIFGSLALTIVGYGFLLAKIHDGFGIFFVIWSIAAPLIILFFGVRMYRSQ